MKHDLEYWLAYPLRWLAKWAGEPYDAKWRNGQVAHVFAGWSLFMTAWKWSVFLVPLVMIYPIIREINDSKWFKNWNRKNWADLITFLFGELIGWLIVV